MLIKATTVRPDDTLLVDQSISVMVNDEGKVLTEYLPGGKYVVDVVGVKWEGRNTLRIDGAIWTGDPDNPRETIRMSVFLYLLDFEKVDRL